LQLLAAVQTFGCNWQLVSANLVGRIGNQCSNRYCSLTCLSDLLLSNLCICAFYH
uniref:HTH myb-type domain-containing protein n=1 Tax=Aegilops tauschii subsp. strangulata TaxID=200361 RepID=A0A453L992_AEGTS